MQKNSTEGNPELRNRGVVTPLYAFHEACVNKPTWVSSAALWFSTSLGASASTIALPRMLPPAPQKPSTWNRYQRCIYILSEFAHVLEWSLQWTLGNPGSEGYRLVQYFFLGSSSHLLQEGISSENFGKAVFLNDLDTFPSTACLLRRKLKS